VGPKGPSETVVGPSETAAGLSAAIGMLIMTSAVWEMVVITEMGMAGMRGGHRNANDDDGAGWWRLQGWRECVAATGMLMMTAAVTGMARNRMAATGMLMTTERR
jgi:hypothetical protein